MMTPPAYSAAPLASIDTANLKSTRFIEADERKYPFRDALGRINLHLVNASLAEAEVDKAPPVTRERLQAWQRHAVRAINSRPKDEQATLDDLFGDEENLHVVEPQVPKTVETAPGMRRRLFRAPKDEDEPSFDSSPELSADHMYVCRMVNEGATKADRAAYRKATRPRKATSIESSSSDVDEDDETYEVHAVLDEDELGGQGFLIEWAGFGPEHNSWEPEWNVAPHLVAEFRRERSLARRHVGDDYMLGRQKMLWCSSCCLHRAADSFSATMRRQSPDQRTCLTHHYKGEGSKAPETVSSVTGAKLSSHVQSCPPTPFAAASATPPRVASLAASGQKRPRSEEHARTPASRLPPPPPLKAPRPVARALSQRAAALEMRTNRLFGFGSF